MGRKLRLLMGWSRMRVNQQKLGLSQGLHANEKHVPEARLQLQGASGSSVTLCPASWGGGGAGATTSFFDF